MTDEERKPEAAGVKPQGHWNLSTIPASFTITPLQEDVLDTLSQRDVVIPNPAELRRYLAQYPDMVDVLVPVCQYARRIVGAEAQFSLEMFFDPESDDEYLTLYVRQSHYDDSLMERIEDIANHCESLIEEKSGWLLVTTDFAKPK